MEQQKVIISHDLRLSLSKAIAECPHDKLFVLCDRLTRDYCMPVVADFDCLKGYRLIAIDEGDIHKNLHAVEHVWNELQQQGATRHSLLINLGGGMVTDLGGFVASTFKRGMQFINIPTTLLAMIDASVGGKTGINFGGLKNEIGVFSNANSVILDTIFLQTLDHENILSGYAEMLKHSLISDEQSWAELLTFNLEELDYTKLGSLVAKSVSIKERIVEEDPTEKGIRKALNLGHTAGHALESMALEKGRPILHGYAVAWGLICELYLSVVKCDFPKDRLRQTVQFIKLHYGDPLLDCKQYERLYEFMKHDKKNEGDSINFTLLGSIGDIRINQQATKDEIFEMLDFLREG